MASSSSSPKGLTIGGDGPRKPQWKLGKLIGTGACASVHTLLDSNGKETSFVVKVVPLPQKTTKKKTSLVERNARLLHYEGLMYQAQFADYQGFVIPKLPPYIGPPSHGDKDGFRFIIMEKMKGSFWDIIPPLLKSKSSTDNTIAIGPIAEHLLTCVEVFHGERHLVVDIKPENFMLAYNDHDRKRAKSSAKKNVAVVEDLAAKVRILDLGLIVRYRDGEGHKPNDGISEIVGTPLYASLNAHDGQTPSRRDDIQALGYVISELIIRVVAAANGETAEYEGKGKDAIPSYLPWAQGKSDEAIGKVKEKEVKNANSQFYKRMGDKATAQTMKELFDMTSEMKYKEEPNYVKIRELLSSLVVSLESTKKKAAAVQSPKKKTAAKPKSATRSTRATKRTASNVCDVDEEDEEYPTKFPKTEDEEEEGFFDAAMDDVESVDDDGEDEDDFVDAQAEEMDWEPLKENRTKSGGNIGLKIVIEDGPHKGEHFDLTKGDVEAVIIGTSPTASNAKLSDALWPLPGDEDVEDTHARLDLKATRQVCSVKVTMLKSKTDKQAFISDSFTIGQSTFRVQQLSEAGSQPQPAAKKAKVKATGKKGPLKEKKKAATNDTTETADVNLVVVSGPNKGDSFSLSKSTQAFNFGSARSVAKKGVPVVLDGIEKQHVRVQLQKSKKLTRVCVTDLSETAGTSVNGKKIAKKKEVAAFINDRITIGDTTIEIRDN